MQITVLGAAGKVGQLVVAEALKRGHTVIAVIHSADPFTATGNLRTVAADVHDAVRLGTTLDGSDAVISTLGSWGTPQKDIVATAMRNLAPAMQQHRISRIVSLTGNEAVLEGDSFTVSRFITHTLASLFAGKILYDGEEHLRLLRNSDLDWTCLRSPVMTNRPQKFYRLSLQAGSPWRTISRKAVAVAMLDQIDGPGYSQAAPFLHQR